MNINKIFILIPLILAFNSIKSQSFFDSENLSISGTFGFGKIQYFFEDTPVYILVASQEAVEYSPSWNFRIDKSFFLTNLLNFSIGFSHLTITEKTKQTAMPGWFEFSETNLSQGFLHLIPRIIVKLPDERFKVNLGLRLGTANFIGNSLARETSNSLGSLHADLSLESGFSILLTKKLFLEAELIYGFTKYDYSITMPVEFISYYKYHSFQTGIRYIINESKAH